MLSAPCSAAHATTAGRHLALAHQDAAQQQYWFKVSSEVSSWLSSLGPLRVDAPLPYRLLLKYLRSVRDRKEARYRASCTVC
jgi:hypothetical protein